MKSEVRIVGIELARQMWSVEDSIDESIKRIGEMIGQLPVARKRCRMSGTVGQDVFAGAALTLQRLVDARGEAINLHGQMSELADQAGIPLRMMGSDWKLEPGRGLFAMVANEAA